MHRWLLSLLFAVGALVSCAASSQSGASSPADADAPQVVQFGKLVSELATCINDFGFQLASAEDAPCCTHRWTLDEEVAPGGNDPASQGIPRAGHISVLVTDMTGHWIPPTDYPLFVETQDKKKRYATPGYLVVQISTNHQEMRQRVRRCWKRVGEEHFNENAAPVLAKHTRRGERVPAAVLGPVRP